MKNQQFTSRFLSRHIGPRDNEINEMLHLLGVPSFEELVEQTVPDSILNMQPLNLGPALSEPEAICAIRKIAEKNKVFRSYIGMGYADSVTPAIIQRNILENPGWYTQYTPYQAEISQGRLEALLNFQTMVADLVGCPVANASLLDEGTAAAEAMALCAAAAKDDRRRFFVAGNVHPQTISVLRTRAEPVGIELVVGTPKELRWDEQFFGGLIQYPTTDGAISDYRSFVDDAHQAGALVVAATDLLSLTLLTPPGEWGADVVVGNSQRFGVPLGFGGPHAAFLATREQYKRLIPGRIVGVSRDSSGRPALRLALQTREQHIRRDKATSNICTAQVLLAIMASMYAVYHGPEGLRSIALSIRAKTLALARFLKHHGFKLCHSLFFDTIRIYSQNTEVTYKHVLKAQINLRRFEDGSLGVSLDETVRWADIAELGSLMTGQEGNPQELIDAPSEEADFPSPFRRKSAYLTHPVFNSYHSETEMLRYIHRLQSGDLSLTHSMIPLGSCTMKLNATTEMLPVSWPEFSAIHPYAPIEQTVGYRQLIKELEQMLCELTGLAAVSLQPNAGSQGEYAGLLAIRHYHKSRSEPQRKMCLIPTSAHGTNPASAVMAGLQVVTVKCDEQGNVDLRDLGVLADRYQDELAALMITYPSTHGVFEEDIKEITEIIHGVGGQVYMDGANLNAQVGLCRPGEFGVDVCHLNLHKTFCIPHGGGGPGVGPIAVAAHLAPFLPTDPLESGPAGGPVSSAAWGSAGILPISWIYIRMLGSEGLKKASQVAILNANYIAKRLEAHYPTLYRGRRGWVAHECILDCRRFRKDYGITVADIAKRLIDYGFHAPTVSFPVVETLMVEPTESESKLELDRFCDAMIQIRREIEEVAVGIADSENNVLKNAPHTAEEVAADVWDHPYSRQKAAFPAEWLRSGKFWSKVSRIDESYGDRNFFCQCPPVEAFEREITEKKEVST